MRIVIALGGNALLRRGEPAEADAQRRNVATAVAAIADLAADHEVIVTHGNVIVDLDDPGFAHPTKPIGPIYDRTTAERLAAERGWTVAPDGRHYRRVVPSPEPRSIVELEALRLLVDAGVLVVCVGGGGIPVAVDRDGRLRGVEAVIDKDLAAALLARGLGAYALLLLTDVPAVQANWGTPDARDLSRATPRELRALSLAAGSMGPKVEAACRFAEATGGIAGIGALADARAILRCHRGTTVAATEGFTRQALDATWQA